MAKYNKSTFKTLTDNGVTERDGYTFGYELADGTEIHLGLYKSEGRKGLWNVIALDCGKKLCTGATRNIAVEKAGAMRSRFSEFRASSEYAEEVGKFNELLAKEKETDVEKPITVECFGREFYASHQAGTRIKVGGGQLEFIVGKTYKYREKGREYELGCLGYDNYRGERKIMFCVFYNGEWQGYLRTIAWEKLKAIAKHPLDTEAPETTKEDDMVTEINLETMQAWCKDKGLKARQVHPGSDDNVWIVGPSKPHKPELLEMGFRWGTSKHFGKGWYHAPTMD